MVYKVFLNTSKRAYNPYKYCVLAIYKNNINIAYKYNEIKDKIPKTKIQPTSYCFTSAKDAEHLKTINYGYEDWQELSGLPSDYNLEIPEHYKHNDVEFKMEIDSLITDEMFDQIKKAKKIKISEPFVIVGENFEDRFLLSSGTARGEEYICPKCHKIFLLNKNRYQSSYTCPFCGNTSYNGPLVMKDFKDFRKNNYGAERYYNEMCFSGYNTNQKNSFYYVKNHSDDENGIIIYKICQEIIANKNTITTRFSVEYSIEHIIGKKMIAYKHLKRAKKECDPFEVLGINTKNINRTPCVIYDGCDKFFDFINKNEKFLRMSGFQTVLKYSPMQLNLEPFFFVFIGIVNKYPIMEQIVKMGHAKLFFNLYKEMLNSLNKEELNKKINDLSQLVDIEATKGKDALRFPNYIGDYLIKKDANLDEYYYWRDLYEITKMTKEQFEKLIDSFTYSLIISQVGISDIGNILKYGYSVEKLFNYIIKQANTNNHNVQDIIYYLSDYLLMCDFTGIKPDKYPKDLKKVHDDMLVYYEKQKKAEDDKKLALIANECESYVIPNEEELNKIGIPKLFENMTVVFPKSESDFIDEGNQQHNCVGSYPYRVKNGNCVIFFIRYKDSPDKSFITAECTTRGLGQCYYSNNRSVKDENLMNFARYIVKKILAGISSGQINALGKVNK